MLNVVVLIKDDRVRKQVEVFLRELDVDDIRLASFKTQSEFQELYFRDPTPPPPPPAEGEAPPEAPVEPVDEGADLKLFSEVHLVIFSLDSIDSKSGPWIDRLRTNMKRYKHVPEGGHMRLVMLKWEDDGVQKTELIHPSLDDLIYLPLDRLVFLQKMQIVLTLPKRVSPRYLFNQEVNLEIEISKLTRLERMNDVMFAIRNPVPLKQGLPGHFYINFPSEKTTLEVKGKVLRSVPHPEHPGQFLVYFTYFGLPKPTLTAIRKVLTKAPQYKSLLNEDRERYRYQADDLFLMDNERQTFSVVAIDTDEVSGNSLVQTIKKEMDRVNVAFQSSYSLFLYRYMQANGAVGSKTPPKATEISDFYSVPISMTVSCSDLRCLSVDPGPEAKSEFLGHDASALFSTPDKWLSLIQDKESRLVVEEAVQLAAKGRVLERLLILNSVNNSRMAVNFKFYQGSSDNTAVIEMKPASLADILDRMQSEQSAKSLDGIIIDGSFVPAEPTEWIAGLRNLAMKQNLVNDPRNLKFWLVGDQEQNLRVWMNCPDLLGYFIKPVDQRQLLFSLAEHLPNHNTLYQFDNLGFSEPNLHIHASKEVHLEALSEYGATLKIRQKMAPGTIIYLRKSIFDNAPNNCLAARVYACEEHPSEKGVYQIYTTYFGITDAFLKFARTWIRENYASQKSAGQG